MLCFENTPFHVKVLQSAFYLLEERYPSILAFVKVSKVKVFIIEDNDASQCYIIICFIIGSVLHKILTASYIFNITLNICLWAQLQSMKKLRSSVAG